MKEVKTDKCFPLRADVFQYMGRCHQQFDFIFADPPYALKNLAEIPDKIFEYNLLKEDGLFVLEHGKDLSFENHPNFVEHRHYGSVNFTFFAYKTEEEENEATEQEPADEQPTL